MKKYIFISAITLTMFLMASCNKKAVVPNANPSTSETASQTEKIENKETSSFNSETTSESNTDVVVPSQESSTSDSETTSKKSISTQSITLNRKKLKKLLEQAPTFEQIKDKYDLKKEDNRGLKGIIYASSGNIPGLSFTFNNWSDGGKITLQGISAPASMMFPEYVNKRTDQIPILLQDNGVSYFMVESMASYKVNPSKPGYLSGDDLVRMQK